MFVVSLEPEAGVHAPQADAHYLHDELEAHRIAIGLVQRMQKHAAFASASRDYWVTCCDQLVEGWAIKMKLKSGRLTTVRVGVHREDDPQPFEDRSQ